MDLASLVETFNKHDTAFISVSEKLDTGSATGRFMVNILGGEDPDLHDRLIHVWAADPAVKIQLYGKQVRPGRKVGHVTALGTDLADARARARRAASYLADGVEQESY